MCEGEPGGLGGIEGTKWQMICLVKVFIDIFFWKLYMRNIIVSSRRRSKKRQSVGNVGDELLEYDMSGIDHQYTILQDGVINPVID